MNRVKNMEKQQSLKLKEISQQLKQIGTILTALDEELDRENQAIRQRDSEMLTSSTDSKIALLQSMQISSNSLTTLMSKHGYHDQQVGLKNSALAFELGDIWTTFCEKMEACNDKNIVNGQAIEMTKTSTDRVIDLLRGNDKPVYGRTGTMQANYDTPPLGEA
ncbi:MAG: flagella synthesis protein FlgN [Gammaproteobacteria bacterium]